MNAAREVFIGQVLLERILSLAGEEMILIGGQALALWADYYGVEVDTIATTA